MDGNFRVEIPNLPKLQQALASYPSIATPIVQKAVIATQAILASNTNPSTVPYRTRYLLQNWGWEVGNLQARWWPKAEYAPYVEFGTAPHVIEVKNARVLANKQTGQFFGKRVNHPGTAANPFMERILAASQPAITDLFEHAMENITAAIATAANG